MKALILKTIDGKLVHAHGGGIIKHGNYYYLYGENRSDDNYVSIYKSKDLKKWEFCNNVLAKNSKEESINGYKLGLSVNGHKCNIERPKIFYSEKLKKFVMWAHYENGEDYLVASACVATCDTIDGDYVFHGYFKPFGHMSRDCAIFEDNGRKYFISAANDNADLHIYLLKENDLGVEKLVNKLFIGKLREAPAIFKKNGIYYLLSSYCTGWFPNQCRYATAKSLDGKFSRLINLGNKTTSHSQPTNILLLGNSVIYLGDRWGGLGWSDYEHFDYSKSCYVYSYLTLKDKRLVFSSKKVKF